MASPPSFNPQTYFPPRRRAVQACAACRTRKIRCDAAAPKCSLCVHLNIECVYTEAHTPKIDNSTRVLLDRIQQLEDKFLSSLSWQLQHHTAADFEGGKSNGIPTVSSAPQLHSCTDTLNSPLPATQETILPNPYTGSIPSTLLENDVSFLPLPAAHTATANHVYRWPVLQAMLARVSTTWKPNWKTTFPVSLSEPTDIFYLESSQPVVRASPESWRLFDVTGLRASQPRRRKQALAVQSQVNECRILVEEYFLDVNVFFPILRKDHVLSTLSNIVKSECSQEIPQDSVTDSQYCLILLVLSLGAWAKSDNSLIFSSNHERSAKRLQLPQDERGGFDSGGRLANQYWQKATLLLGPTTAENKLEAAQCYALASIFMGAQGRVVDSHHYIHTAAEKCTIIAKRCILQERESPVFSDSFRRLFWIVYVYESDFLSELSLTPPSGITQFEDIVPYPASEQGLSDEDTEMELRGNESSLDAGFQDFLSTSPGSANLQTDSHQTDLIAFQISTNSALRRFFNRVNAVIYDPNEAWRKKNHNTYVTWLLKISRELGNHQDAVHRNLPSFLLTEDPGALDEAEGESSSPTVGHQHFFNHPWNVARLNGRYWAGRYLTNRSFVEYVLLNPIQFEIHPSKADILEKCKICLKGCSGFVRTFSREPNNSTTNLFTAGMTTFTMMTIVMMSAASTSLQSILPADIEEVIAVGQRNLRRFSTSINEFEWHLQELEKLDEARKLGM